MVSPRSGGADLVVTGFVGELGKTKLLEQRWQVHAEPHPDSLS